mmetsp:Transcript_60484/g.129767  ORF Transcript_60484/g.129767 Transcript_60484/m.129767 type:complete len:312 (-) Transcript_60484:193-1128(-)
MPCDRCMLALRAPIRAGPPYERRVPRDGGGRFRTGGSECGVASISLCLLTEASNKLPQPIRADVALPSGPVAAARQDFWLHPAMTEHLGPVAAGNLQSILKLLLVQLYLSLRLLSPTAVAAEAEVSKMEQGPWRLVLPFRSASLSALSNSSTLTSPVPSRSRPTTMASKSLSEKVKSRRARPARSSLAEMMPLPLLSMARKTSIIRVLLRFSWPLSWHITASVRSSSGCLRGDCDTTGSDALGRLLPGFPWIVALLLLAKSLSASSNSLKLSSPLPSASMRLMSTSKYSSLGCQPNARRPALSSRGEIEPS